MNVSIAINNIQFQNLACQHLSEQGERVPENWTYMNMLRESFYHSLLVCAIKMLEQFSLFYP